MNYEKYEDFTLQSVPAFLMDSVDSVLVVNSETDEYRRLSAKGFLADFIPESGSYHDLVEALWFHFSDSGDKITENYHVFVPSFGKFDGKYSRRVKVNHNDEMHLIQMLIYPAGEGVYVFTLNELDESESQDEVQTHNKVTTIQNTYLFSMYIDLVRNTTSSISITEISDETVNTQISYTDWRMMIVNMIWPDDQELFLKRTDPEYMKAHYHPGRTSSFDCLMQNLEGTYIWVKLIFCRSETKNEEDFRYVFMVQDIHESTVSLMSTLKKYEEMASTDPLTGVWNHGRIETEIQNAIKNCRETSENACLMMLDIDFFKNVNDKFGHSVGDLTLKQFAQTVTDYMKDYGGIVGRWGGEEFVVVCYGQDLATMKIVAENLRIFIENQPFKAVGSVTGSIGLTPLHPYETSSEAFERVDKAMYEAKHSGRNRVIVNEGF